MFFYKTDPTARTPIRNAKKDSGWDVFALGDEPTVIHPGEIVKVRTGLVFACPVNTPSWGWDKSGPAAKGLKVLGGVIDELYVGEISIVLGNMNLWNIIKLLMEDLQGLQIANAIHESTITIEPGHGVAQMVFHSIVDLQEMRELSEEGFRKEFAVRFKDGRGTKGFGGVSQEHLTLKESSKE